MNGVDWVVLLFSLSLGVRGYRRGLLRALSETVAAVIAVLAAVALTDPLARLLFARTGMPLSGARITVFLLLAIAMTAGGLLLSNGVVRYMAAAPPLDGVDAVAGLVFGFVKALFFGALLVVSLAQIPVGAVTDALDGSWFGRTVLTVAPAAYRHFPK